MTITTIKITELDDIGSGLDATTLIPVVNMTGTPTTEKAVFSNVANAILGGAGIDYVPVAVATLAGTVTTSAQPNITSIGTLTNLSVAVNTTSGNVLATSLVRGTTVTALDQLNTANLSSNGLANIARINVTNTANLGAVGNVTITGGTSGYVLSTNGSGGLSWVAQTGGGGTYGNSDVANYLPTFTGNVGAGNVIATANLYSAGLLSNGVANVNSNVISTNYNTGALKVRGGAGIVGNVHSGGEIHSGGNVIVGGQSLFVGPSADATGLTNPTIIAFHGGTNYIQAALKNSLSTGSADWVAYGDNGTDNQGWADFGFTSSAFDDPAYTITGAGDGYFIVETFAGSYGGNLIIATGSQGTVRDIIFATNGFDITNEFARISDSNNSFELTRTGASLTFPDGSIQTTAYTGGGGANTGNVTFNDVNIIGDGNLYLQPDPNNAGAYLDVYLTSGPDIHLVASSSANLILGKDNGANVMTSWDGNVTIQSWSTNTDTQGGVWTFGGDGTLTFPDNSGSSWPIASQRFGMGNIGAWLDGQWTIGEFSGNGVSGQVGIRIDPGIEGNTGITIPSQASSTTQPVSIYNTGGGGIELYTGANNWEFSADGNLNFPNNANIATIGNVTQFNTCANGFLGLNSYDAGGNNLARVNISSIDGLVGIGTYDPNTDTDYSWTFNNNGSTIFPTLTVDLHNGGNQSAQTLQFGDSTKQAIITGPTPPTGQSAQRLIIQGQRANGAYNEGGDIYVWGGDSDTNGGDIKIYAGDADSGTGSGGYINLAGGAGGDQAGYINIDGGYSANGYGGYININGGSSGNGIGGNIDIQAGQSGGGNVDGAGILLQGGYSQSANGGAVTLRSGPSGLGLPGYGNVLVEAGASQWKFDNTGNLVLPSNSFAINYANGTQAQFSQISKGNSNVNIPDTNGNVYITSNGGTQKQWSFDTNGLLRTPGDISIFGGTTLDFHQQVGNITWGTNYMAFSQYGRVELNTDFFANANVIGAQYLKGNGSNISNIAGANVSGTVGNANLSQYLAVSDVNNNFSYHVVLSAGSGDKDLHIDADDNLQYNPADGILTTTRLDATYVVANLNYANGYLASNLVGSMSNIANGNSNVSIATANGNVAINSAGNSWNFDTTGNLTLPSNTFSVNYANGTQVSLGGSSVAEASFSIQTGNFNATAGSRYGVNTSGGAVTATLPAGPATGVAIFFADAGGAYASNNLTINPNGQTIMGASGNMTVSTNNQSVGLFYNGTTWRTYNAG